MDEKAFEKLLQSVKWAGKYMRGEKVKGGRVTPVLTPEEVRATRQQTKLSQEKFAHLIEVDVGTLRNWEQGRRQPTGPARVLLRAIRNDPIAVVKALKAA